MKNISFNDDRDYQYFCVFRDQTAFELAGGFDPSLWRTLVVEACNNESIRELTTAVAALNIADKQSKSATGESRNSQNDMNSNLEYALLQYGKALKGIQNTVSAGQDSMRIALIAALLIFVFESLHGDTTRALTPIQISIDLILKRLSTMHRPYRGSLTNAKKTPSSLPVDEDLLIAFVRLDGVALSLIRKPSIKLTQLLDQPIALSSTGNYCEIPSGFATISEARKYLDDISWRSEAIPEQLSGTLRSCYIDIMDKNSDSTENQLLKWIEAFAPLFQHSLTPAGSAGFMTATILQVSALSQILFVTSFENQEANHMTQTIISLTKRLVEYPNFSKRFVFDAGVLPAMIILIIFSPQKEAKEEAYELVRAMTPRREGYWSSVAIAKAASKLLKKGEEKNFGTSSAGQLIDSRLRGLEFDTFMGEDMYDFGMQGINVEDEEMIDPMLSGPGPSQVDKGKAGEYYIFRNHLKMDPDFFKEFLGVS